MMADVISNKALYRMATGALDWQTGDVRVLLVAGASAAYTPNKDHATLAAVLASGAGTAVEYAGANYVRKVLTGVTVAESAVDDDVRVAADDMVWAALGLADGSEGEVGWAVVYLHVTSDADSVPLVYREITGTPNGTNFTLPWSTSRVVDFGQGTIN